MKKKISEFLGSIDIIISLTSFLSEGLMRWLSRGKQICSTMDASKVKQTQGRNIFPRVTEDIRDSEQQLIEDCPGMPSCHPGFSLLEMT